MNKSIDFISDLNFRLRSSGFSAEYGERIGIYILSKSSMDAKFLIDTSTEIFNYNDSEDEAYKRSIRKILVVTNIVYLKPLEFWIKLNSCIRSEKINRIKGILGDPYDGPNDFDDLMQTYFGDDLLLKFYLIIGDF
jgi:hypothetical protein